MSADIEQNYRDLETVPCVEKPRVTIVTPVYNTADYLKQCIESVLAQDYDNFRYLIVDNCSTDGSGKIASEYARIDSRIEVVRNESLLEQVDNYNHALRLACIDSQYVKIVQADDWIFPNCIRLMTEVAEENETVGIVSAYRLIGERLAGDGLPVDSTFFAGREIARRQLLRGDFFFGSPTTIMYRASVIRRRHDFFDSSFLHEDTAACYRELENCDFGFVHQVLTYSRVGNESISLRVREFNPNALDKLIVLNKFGPGFLDRSELKDVTRLAERKYYRFLAKSVLRFRKKPFWKYHAEGLAAIDRKILSWGLLSGLFVELSNRIFNLKKSLGSIIRWVGRHLGSRS